VIVDCREGRNENTGWKEDEQGLKLDSGQR